MVLALAMSAVSLYYYLRVLKQIYIAEPVPGTGTLSTPTLSRVALALLAIAVVLLGCAPNLLLGPLLGAMQHPSAVP